MQPVVYDGDAHIEEDCGGGACVKGDLQFGMDIVEDVRDVVHGEVSCFDADEDVVDVAAVYFCFPHENSNFLVLFEEAVAVEVGGADG